MSLAPTYACFGCVDFANNARTQAYVGWACRTGRYNGDPMGMLKKARSLCVCADDDAEWTNPIDDDVCWYDPLVPESADFLGVAIVGTTGIRSSSYKREIRSGLNGGSILGLPTIDGKQLMLDVELYATSQAGMNYGIAWLRKQFEGDGRCPADGASCSSCQGQLLTLRTHCPTETSLDDGLHSWPAAGAIDGFEPDDDKFPIGRRHCEKATSGTITIATEQHGSFSTNPIGSIEVDVSGAFTALGNCAIGNEDLEFPCCPICGETCDPCTTDPGCDCLPPFVLEPQVLTSGAPCFTDPLCRCIGAVAIENLPAGYETALRMTLQAGWDPTNAIFSKFGMRNFVFRVFENPSTEDFPDGLPLPTDLASFDFLVERLLPCAEIGVSWMPAGSELVIDGLSGQTWLKCQGRCVDHSDRVEEISGTMFPLKAHCTNMIVTVEWDCLNSQSRDAADTILSSLVAETFLAFNL